MIPPRQTLAPPECSGGVRPSQAIGCPRVSNRRKSPTPATPVPATMTPTPRIARTASTTGARLRPGRSAAICPVRRATRARPAHRGRFAPAGSGAGLLLVPELPGYRAASCAGGETRVAFPVPARRDESTVTASRTGAMVLARMRGARAGGRVSCLSACGPCGGHFSSACQAARSDLRMRLKHLQRHDVQRAAMRGPQPHPGGRPFLMRLQEPAGAQAPPVAGPQSGKAVFGARC